MQCGINVTSTMSGRPADRGQFEAFRITDLNISQLLSKYLLRLKIVMQHDSGITLNLFI